MLGSASFPSIQSVRWWKYLVDALELISGRPMKESCRTGMARLLNLGQHKLAASPMLYEHGHELKIRLSMPHEGGVNKDSQAFLVKVVSLEVHNFCHGHRWMATYLRTNSIATTNISSVAT